MNEEAPPPERNGRKYRSKKQRPCDLCRTRKIQCKLQGDRADCELCQRLERQCTFVLGPLRRKYRPRGDVDNNGTSEPSQPRPEGSVVEPAFGEMTMPDSRDPNAQMDMDLDMDSFWLPQTDLPQPFGTRDAPSLLMNWYTMGSPFGRNPNENGQMYSRPRGEADAGFLQDMPQPPGNLFRPASQGTAPTTASSESPGSISGPSAHRGAQFVGIASPEGALNDGLQRNYGGNPHDAHRPSDWPLEYSLESKKGYSNHLIGLSCESDPFLLRQYRYNSHDNYHMFRLDFRQIHDGIKPQAGGFPPASNQSQSILSEVPLQFMMSDEAIWQDDIKATEKLLSGSDGSEAADMALLNKIVNPDLGARLVKLYTRFVHPRYPVLSLSDLKRILGSESGLSFPIGLKTAIYALAAPFTFLDDELSVSKGYWEVPTDDLWAIAHRSFQRASCLSHLSLLQLCLLLLQMPPQNWVVAEPSKFWALSCSAVAIAENLGVNVDPSGWRLPRTEIMVRKRLWWLTYIAHTWHALVCGRPSHITDSNWYVSKLTEDDFERGEGEDAEVRKSMLQQIPICLAQYELGVIAADVLKEFYSVRANSESIALTALLNRAQPLRTRIESWRQTLPLLSTPISELSEDDFDNGAALRLSHLTLEIMIFRALLRPLSFDAAASAERCQEPISTIFENCYVCANVATDIVSSLRAKHFASFWPHYLRYKLCYVSSFILLNLAQSTTKDMAVRNKALLGKWRDTLRIQARAWPLARLAAMRLDAVFWKGLALTIHGAGPDSPAIMLLKETGSGESGS